MNWSSGEPVDAGLERRDHHDGPDRAATDEFEIFASSPVHTIIDLLGRVHGAAGDRARLRRRSRARARRARPTSCAQLRRRSFPHRAGPAIPVDRWRLQLLHPTAGGAPAAYRQQGDLEPQRANPSTVLPRPGRIAASARWTNNDTVILACPGKGDLLPRARTLMSPSCGAKAPCLRKARRARALSLCSKHRPLRRLRTRVECAMQAH